MDFKDLEGKTISEVEFVDDGSSTDTYAISFDDGSTVLLEASESVELIPVKQTRCKRCDRKIYLVNVNDSLICVHCEREKNRRDYVPGPPTFNEAEIWNKASREQEGKLGQLTVARYQVALEFARQMFEEGKTYEEILKELL